MKCCLSGIVRFL